MILQLFVFILFIYELFPLRREKWYSIYLCNDISKVNTGWLILRQTTITHSFIPSKRRGRHCHDRMVLGLTTTYTLSAYHYLICELESHSWRCALDAILFDKVCQGFAAGRGFLRILLFPLPLKLTTTIELTYCWKWR